MQTELSLNSEWLMKCRSDHRQTIESRSEPFITLKANASARTARWMIVPTPEREEREKKERTQLSSPHEGRSESPLLDLWSDVFFPPELYMRIEVRVVIWAWSECVCVSNRWQHWYHLIYSRYHLSLELTKIKMKEGEVLSKQMK